MRRLSTEPIGLVGSFNPYAYCQGSPMNLVDPVGLAPVSWSYSKSGNLGPVDNYTPPERSPLDPDGAIPMTIVTLIIVGEVAVAAAPAVGYLMLQGGTALEAYGFGSAGVTLATGGTSLTFWGLGIGGPKVIPNARDAKIPEEKNRNYALDPNHENGRHKARVFKSALDIERSIPTG